MQRVEQEFKINIKCLMNEMDNEDALKEYEHLIDPIIEEIEKKLSDRFDIRISSNTSEVIDIEEESKNSIESAREEEYRDGNC